MKGIYNSSNCIIVKDRKELEEAKSVDVCRYIIWEDKNAIYIWTRENFKWVRTKYVEFGNSKEKDTEITGFKAYQDFFSYCGKDEVERMKHILEPISMWESCEQLHYANYEHANEKIYQDIFEFDARSAFTYGTFLLPKGFEPLKEYMGILFDKKELSTNSITRSRFKNLQNYLIGYFARVKDFVRVRSEVIFNSNMNIEARMREITKKGGKVYLSNTDSIVTDNIGADVMQKYLGKQAGQFKLECQASRLFYKSPNAYQLGDKIVYSGVPYFARKHTDFFEDRYATQFGSLIKGFNFLIDDHNTSYRKLCRVDYGEIEVVVTNSIGEELDRIYYKIGD